MLNTFVLAFVYNEPSYFDYFLKVCKNLKNCRSKLKCKTWRLFSGEFLECSQTGARSST